jgi:hypothetical protein
MSVIKLPYLYCDAEDCVRLDGGQQPFIVDPLPGDTAASLREQAKAQGWAYRKGKDYCELCAVKK